MKALLLGFVTVIAAQAAAAQDWYEPPRGSPERRDLMNAMRPFAEGLFGPPVEFVVNDLRVSGNVAFASVAAQRPGGGAIDVQSTPGWASGYFMLDAYWIGGQALFRRQGQTWMMADGVFGATDVWWADPALCRTEFRRVISDVC